MIFGIRAVIEAIEAGKEIDKLLIKKDLQGDLSRELFNILKGRHIPVQRVPVEKLNRITRKNHQGVIAYTTQITYQHIEDIVPSLFEEGKNPFFVLLDGLTDVRNFGAIARTCACAGADAIIVPAKGGVAINGDAIKTSAGALHTLKVCKVDNLASCINYLRQSGLNIIAATEHAKAFYTQVDMKTPLAIVMGSEDKGISPDVLKLCNQQVRIPMIGPIESLNVSVAAGVMMYEVVRQRG